jgi:kinesin family member C1
MLQGQEAIQQLEVSNKLLSIMEVREEAERRERVACSAQLLATQTQCANQIRELEEKMAAAANALQNDILLVTAQRDAANVEIRAQSDVAMRLESEVQQLKRSLEDASISSETIEELAKLTGECEVLKRRIREASERKEFEGTASSDRINDLTERMRLGEIQRRKLHNLVQELRGNVRVFARVRPFLPSDGLNLSVEPSPPTSINVRSDDVSLRISRVGGGGGAQSAIGVERAEDHSFTFDRTFGPSSSQESVFQEVSEFVQSALDGYNVCLFSYGQTGSGKVKISFFISTFSSHWFISR